MKSSLIFIISLTLLTGCTLNYEDKIDQLLSVYNNPDLPGAAVMVIKDGKINFQKGYGIANVELGIPIDSFTNFRLASITKQFTAMSILMLIERGEINFNTTLKEIFPDFPEYGSKINIKHLLQHTSGLIDYEDLIHDSVTVQLKDKDVLDLIILTDSTYYEPGSKHQYSNSGYALLALTVEKISGKPFRDFLHNNIFKPLEMETTIAFENNINEVSNRAYGYTITENGIDLTDQSITSAVLGDGGIYSSLNDLFKWDQALYTESLIDEKYLIESWTPGITSNGTEIPYGYGWHVEKRYNSDVVYHTGSTRGFRNINYRIPGKHFTIVILTNRNARPERTTLELAYKIADLYFNDD